MDLLTADDYAPFDLVTVSRLPADDGETAAWVNLRGLKDEEVQEVRVPYVAFQQQTFALLVEQWGKTTEDQITAQEMARATIRAAIIFLTDGA